MQNKKTIIVAILLVGILSMVCAHDYFTLCLHGGETVEFSECNPVIEDRTCDSSLCQYCVYISSFSGAYCPANINKCNALGGVCTFLGETPEVDQTPPEILSINLQEGAVYDDDKLEFLAEADEVVNWYYKNNLEDEEDWDRICREEKICREDVRFEQGFNNITIKAVDLNDNPTEIQVSFFTDDKDPKIRKTYPKRGKFADGNFEIYFKEANPEVLTLYYGSDFYEFDLETECSLEKNNDRYYCASKVELSGYDGGEVEYYFVLEDIAGNIDESRATKVKVDVTAPEILNPENFYTQGEGRYQKYIYFNIEVEEENLDEVFYTYVDSLGRVKEKKLCSKLKDGVCEKRKRFSDGHYELTVVAIDDAGNLSPAYPVVFDVY